MANAMNPGTRLIATLLVGFVHHFGLISGIDSCTVLREIRQAMIGATFQVPKRAAQDLSWSGNFILSLFRPLFNRLILHEIKLHSQLLHLNLTMPVAVNPTDSSIPQVQRLEYLVKHGALNHPSRTAVTNYVDGKAHSLSYSELWDRVRRVASVLRQHIPTDGPTPFVQLFLPNGSDQIVATLATLSAGAAFVPVALDSPPSWCRALNEQTHSNIFITDSTLKDDLFRLLTSAGLEHPIIYDISHIEDYATDPQISREVSTTDPAYVLFSSGTTGMHIQQLIPSRAKHFPRCTKGHNGATFRRLELLQGSQHGLQSYLERQVATSCFIYL